MRDLFWRIGGHLVAPGDRRLKKRIAEQIAAARAIVLAETEGKNLDDILHKLIAARARELQARELIHAAGDVATAEADGRDIAEEVELLGKAWEDYTAQGMVL